MRFAPLAIAATATALALATGLTIRSEVASAHHSTTIYDLRARLVLRGTVVESHWTQPHSFVVINVTNERGGTDRWNVETGTPSVNSRMGWRRTDINAGDVITMTVHPVRTGAKHATASIVVLADGRTLYGPAAGLSGLLPRPPRP